MGKFEINRDKAGEFRFNLKAGNGQVILSSQSYTAKDSCMNGIESVKTNSGEDDRFERSESSSGHHFNLKSSNGQVIGNSEVYTSTSAMENGISSVKNNAPGATIEDLTV